MERIYPHSDQLVEELLIPGAGDQVGEVHKSASGLRTVCLPEVSVAEIQEVIAIETFLKERRFLRDVGTDPQTDTYPVVVDLLDHFLRVREAFVIPEQTGPLESLHPEGTEMDNGKRHIHGLVLLEKIQDRFFAVFFEGRRRDPASE